MTKEQKRFYDQPYYQANREQKLSRQNTYSAMNRDREAARARAWRKANPEKQRALNVSWSIKNKAYISLCKKEYARKNPDIIHANRRLRKARMREARGIVTAAEWLAILRQYDGRCAYCLVSGAMTMDHVNPLSRGGTHTTDNVVPACLTCNTSKQARPMKEFLWT